MDAAEDGADRGRFGLDRRGHLPAIKKSRRRGGKSHKFRVKPQNEADVFLHPGDGPGTQTIVDMDRVAFPFKIGRNGEQPQGGHPVGRGGDVLFAGNPVGPGRVDQNDAHGKRDLFCLLHYVGTSLGHPRRRLSARRVMIFFL